jgi:small subunit ribosomal protein S6
MRKVARPAPKPRKYELMIVVAPTVTEDGLPAVVERVSALIEAQEGAIESVNHDSPWGHRRLAYPIQKFRDAFYVLYYFHVAPRGVAELDRELRLDDAVIRHLIVKFDPLTVRESEGEVDNQVDDREEPDSAPVAATSAPEPSEPDASTDDSDDAEAGNDGEADGNDVGDDEASAGEEDSDEPEAEAAGDSETEAETETDAETDTDDGEEDED